jgi:hypothetical protein
MCANPDSILYLYSNTNITVLPQDDDGYVSSAPVTQAATRKRKQSGTFITGPVAKRHGVFPIVMLWY